MIPKFEKSFNKFVVEYMETNSLTNNKLHFDQYPRLSIRSKNFWFSAINWKTNL